MGKAAPWYVHTLVFLSVAPIVFSLIYYHNIIVITE
jgi:hypothetical protein